jgi:hypothetical protein
MLRSDCLWPQSRLAGPPPSSLTDFAALASVLYDGISLDFVTSCQQPSVHCVCKTRKDSVPYTRTGPSLRMSYEWIHSLPPGERESALDGPSVAPPNGTISHLDNPSNGNGLGKFVAIFCLVVTTLAVCLRAYARFFVHKKLHLEDCTLDPFSWSQLCVLTSYTVEISAFLDM